MNPRKNDFERAVSLLHRDGYTCVLCDRDRVLTSREHGSRRSSGCWIRTNRCRIWLPPTA